MKSEQIRPGVLCRHFKGKLYQIIGKAKDAETGELVVVYQALYGKFQLFVRPVSSFTSKVDKNKYPNNTQEERFELIDRDGLGKESAKTESLYIKQAEDTVHFNQDSNDYGKIEEIKFATEELRNIPNEEIEEEEKVNPHLIAFLDAETYEEKLAVLTSARSDMDDQLLNSMAVSLDVIIPEGEIKDRFIGFKNCLETFRKYECNRFSR